MSKKAAPKGKSVPMNTGNFDLLSFMGTLMNKVGIIGFIVICSVAFIFWYADVDQKKGLIDTWLLFKNPISINISISFNLLMFALLVIHNYHYKFKIQV